MRYWIVLVVSGVFEAVWATALGESHGLTRMLPAVVFLAALAVSMVGLGYAMSGLPASVSYAVWTGIGAAGTVGWAMLTGADQPTVWKLVFLAGIIGCAVALALVTPGDGERGALRPRSDAAEGP